MYTYHIIKINRMKELKMNNSRLSSWAEANRRKLTEAYDAIEWLFSLVLSLVRRTLGGAGVVLIYCFVTVTPETTVYQLSQVVHRPYFWQVAFCIAVTYSVIVFARNGQSQLTPRDRAAATMVRPSGSSSKSGQ